MRRFGLTLVAAALCAGIAVPARVALGDVPHPPLERAAFSPNQLWRISGRVATLDRRAFSFDALFFRYAEPHGVAIYPATFSVLDEAAGKSYSERRVERGGPGFGGATQAPLDVRVGTWRLRALPGPNDPIELAARAGSVQLVLRARARKPRHAIRVGPGEIDEASSLAGSGTIELDGRAFRVQGRAWLTLERSALPPQNAQPVAQFRVALDDGREIFIETNGQGKTMRRRAYLVDRDGTLDILADDAYEFGANPGYWRSPDTRLHYRDVWSLHVDGKTEFLSIEPVRYEQESVANGDGLSFWDGAADVFDVTPGSQGLRLGSAYVLMRNAPRDPAS